MRLDAARVWLSHDDSVAQVAFADRAEAPETVIGLARRLTPNATSTRLGMDGVYIEINGPECSAWRAASAYTFDGATLRIVVSQAALPKLGLTGDILIELKTPELDTRNLRAALAAIFAVEP